MAAQVETSVANPFFFSEYFIIPKPIGRVATNLRELLQALREVDEGVLHYHLWQSRVAISRPAVEYPNDFASWAATALQESRLAEKLSVVDPFAYESMEQIREALVDLVEDYLWDLPYTAWVRPGMEFHFCDCASVVLRSDVSARTLPEFRSGLEKVGLDSIYYHFVDARWRLRSSRMDDFSNWIKTEYDFPDLVSAIQDIDVSFYSLDEVRQTIMDLCDEWIGKRDGQAE
jgi:hypothetical protein